MGRQLPSLAFYAELGEKLPREAIKGAAHVIVERLDDLENGSKDLAESLMKYKSPFEEAMVSLDEEWVADYAFSMDMSLVAAIYAIDLCSDPSDGPLNQIGGAMEQTIGNYLISVMDVEDAEYHPQVVREAEWVEQVIERVKAGEELLEMVRSSNGLFHCWDAISGLD
jgi:acetolactate synthase small subunit